MPNEESGTPLVESVETAPDTTQPATTEAPAAPAAEAGAPAKGWDAVSSWLSSQEFADADLDSHLADIGEASLKDVDDRTRVLLAAVHRKFESDRKAAEEARTKADEERAAKFKAEQDRVAKMERDLKARERALLAASSAATDPGAKPEVDPFTPEGIEAISRYNAQKALYEAQAPIRERAQEEARLERWNAILDKHADLAKPDVLEAFNAFMVEKNKGVKPGQKPRLNTEDGAELFFNLRELEAVRAERAKQQRAEDVARAKAAQNIGRSAGASQPDYLGIYRKIKAERGVDAADEYLDNNPQARAAYVRHFAPGHAN